MELCGAQVGLLTLPYCSKEGQIDNCPALGIANPFQLPTAQHEDTHAFSTQMGLHVSTSPFFSPGLRRAVHDSVI